MYTIELTWSRYIVIVALMASGTHKCYNADGAGSGSMKDVWIVCDILCIVVTGV